jgi:hypothetical protein
MLQNFFLGAIFFSFDKLAFDKTKQLGKLGEQEQEDIGEIGMRKLCDMERENWSEEDVTCGFLLFTLRPTTALSGQRQRWSG